ncbi:DUF2793 domain-containing protein [Sphingomonas sp. R647]|uniref:DUF2793 domain-containing protein n=1 Tax=Sphingomonas sp. R647 TaxID=2875233 RepID=UPI001CD2BCA9|nr:DUF2793 domain-containing protein [Sphingomonas sp. R647]MCA1198734.1 DUF2793 domain-containing protein [Sphingomonas sp. R647]
MTATTRFALPLLHAGQAQKEMFHNEAVVGIDALLHPDVQGVGVNAPPASPEPGEAWIVGDAPSGDWAGHDDEIACWTDGGWRFSVPRAGMEVWAESLAQPVRYRAGEGWQIGVIAASRIDIGGVQVIGARGEAVATPAGGAIVDEQARDAIVAILDALRAHGLIGSAEL